MLTQIQAREGEGAHLLSYFDTEDYYYIPVQYLGRHKLGQDEDGEQQHITISFRIHDNITSEDYYNRFQPQERKLSHTNTMN